MRQNFQKTYKSHPSKHYTINPTSYIEYKSKKEHKTLTSIMEPTHIRGKVQSLNMWLNP